MEQYVLKCLVFCISVRMCFDNENALLNTYETYLNHIYTGHPV